MVMPESSSSLAWVVAQVQISSQEPRPRPHRFNPRPPGVIRPGSATEAVLEFLREHPGRFFRHSQIVQGCGRSKVAVDWALAYLRELGLAEAIPDPLRNARYMRYRIVRSGP